VIKTVELKNYLAAGKLDDLRQMREETRAVYGTELGRRELKDMVKSTFVFDRLSETDTGETHGARNYGVFLLEKMGFLDEENVERLVDYMFTLPVIGTDVREVPQGE
jgi:hypothetical protein